MISDFCTGKIAGFKVPKNIVFIKDEEMPRSGPGKILRRVLREKCGMGSPFYLCVAMQTVKKEIIFCYVLGTALRFIKKQGG